MLDERKTAILRAVVQEYINTAQPVGSTHVASAPGVQRRSATVRNEMAVLEQEGYLAQPHTSAGRIPTDKGYRFFVDHVATPGPARRDRHASRSATSSTAPTARSRRCSTRPPTCSPSSPTHAAVVVGPTARARRRPLGPARRAVGRATPPWSPCCPTARSRTPPSSCPTDTSDARLAAATAHLQAAPHRRAARPRRHGPPERRRRRRRGCAPWRCPPCCPTTPTARRPVFVGGTASMAQAFDAVDTVRSVLAHPRAAVRRRLAGARRPRPWPVGGHRHRARRRAAGRVLGRRRARTSSTASRSARSACSARPA